MVFDSIFTLLLPTFRWWDSDFGLVSPLLTGSQIFPPGNSTQRTHTQPDSIQPQIFDYRRCCKDMMKTHLMLLFLVLLIISPPTTTAFQSQAIFHKRKVLLQSQTKDDISISDCPFSRRFPRYRIDLSRSAKQKEKKGFNVFGGLQLALLQNSLQKKYASVLWLEDQTGMQAFTKLWEATARLAAGEPQVVVALPDFDKRILVNFKEVMDWIQETMEDEIRIETTLLEDNQVVRMDRIGTAAALTSVEPVSHSVVEERTKAWVKRLLVDLSICPFTKSVTKSGQGLGDLDVPVASIAYHTSTTKDVYQLLADTWRAIYEMIEAGPEGKDGISSILLAAPAFDDDFDYWSGPFFTLLENCVVAAQAEAQIGVVCFHPLYATPDGTSWPGFGHMHSVPRLEKWVQEVDGACPYSSDDIAAGGAWQRRTPHATINVLRADQLEMAESRRNTPTLYARNIGVLMDIGNDKLVEDLERERGMGSYS